MVTSQEAIKDVPYLTFERSEGWVLDKDGDFVWGHVANAPELAVPDGQELKIEKAQLDQLGLSASGTALATRMYADHARIIAT